MKLYKRFYIPILFVLLIVFNCSENKLIKGNNLSIVPFPKNVTLNSKILKLKEGLRVDASNKSLQNHQIVLNDFQALLDLDSENTISIIPKIEASYKNEQYQLQISETSIILNGEAIMH